jgi:hypothetical protein
MYQDNRFRFEAEAAMVRKDIAYVNPVAVAVLVRRDARVGKRGEAKGETALAIIVNGTETDLIVAFVDRTVVEKLGGMKEMVAIHATAA